VDIIPKKICSFECIYCQLGKTNRKTVRRFSYVNIEELKGQLRHILAGCPKIDYITISGSGEPTLHKNIDKIIAAIKKVSNKKYPLCLITNSSLLYRKDVRKELQSADVVIPSIDAVDKQTFRRVNRPHRYISFEKMLAGIVKFRQEYKGKLWLEIMVIRNITDSPKTICTFKEIVGRINPDRVFINTPVRPAPFTKANLMPSAKVISEFKCALAESCKLVGFQPAVESAVKQCNISGEVIQESLKRRPQTIKDLVCSLGLNAVMVEKYLRDLVKCRIVQRIVRNKKEYFFVK
jgi:wyosine [tRNA(Phe)-imidazoG37] synthetase (radical SAM superfamily)